jgi:hypothetical protein
MSGSMLASQVPDYSDDDDLVIPEQAPIRVFSDDTGAIAINQHQRRESEDEVYIVFRPEHAFALCGAILRAAGFDPDAVLRGVPKDAGAKERQRRHRGALRDCHGQDNVTATANLAKDVDEPQKMGASTAS